MAHDIDEVWTLCKDIQNTLNDLHPIKTKLDTLIERENILKQCPFCLGSGTEEVSVTHENGRMGPETEVVPCYRCNGDGIVEFATLSANAE